MNSLRIGNTEFNVDALEGITKEEFYSMYKASLKGDTDEAWKAIRKKIGKKPINKFVLDNEVMPKSATKKRRKKSN